jgi:hypothetical protein
MEYRCASIKFKKKKDEYNEEKISVTLACMLGFTLLLTGVALASSRSYSQTWQGYTAYAYGGFTDSYANSSTRYGAATQIYSSVVEVDSQDGLLGWHYYGPANADNGGDTKSATASLYYYFDLKRCYTTHDIYYGTGHWAKNVDFYLNAWHVS